MDADLAAVAALIADPSRVDGLRAWRHGETVSSRRSADRLLRSARTRITAEEVLSVPRILEVMRETFWILALAVIALFAFLVALGAFSPGDAIWATIVVALLCVMWIGHAILEGRHRDTRDPAVVRARERRGF